MVNYCVCAGCANSSLSGHRVHHFPSRKNKSFRAWVRFVQVKRADFTAASVTIHSVICGCHFTPECYHPGDLTEYRMGFRCLDRVRLISDAVPSVHSTESSSPLELPTESGAGGSDGASASTHRDSVHRKRDLSRILAENAASNERTEFEDTDLSTLDARPLVLDTGSQCNIKCPQRSSAVQVKPIMVSVGTQTERFEQQTSTPLPSPASSEDEESCDFMDQYNVSWNPDEEMSSEEDSEGDHLAEPTPESPCDQNVPDKFIVCRSQLMSLFTICPVCSGETKGQMDYQEGTYIKIKQVCKACGYQRLWQNQDMLHRNMPVCNLLLSGAIHFSGCMATQTIRMLKLFGLQCISAS